MFVIGIAGGTGSGKTTFTDAIVEKFGENVTVIHHDNYYNVNDHLTYEERCKVNYDHPDSFETDLMIEHIKKLRAGEAVEEPDYDYTVHNRDKEKSITLKPSKILIVDGILIFENKELCENMDLKIFVDTDADVRLGRRILRDINERGRSIESVLTQYETTVKPMHEKFVEPSKKNADIVILEGGKNKAAIDLISGYIREYIRENE
ncbi:MAG: uridine kinase [Oscillospiraceae bacterium]|nr:uridine kinase [Oscillospiraceae bacterium]